MRDPAREGIQVPPAESQPPAKPESKDGKKDREATKDKDMKDADEDDPQLQKATELLKSWMIFKELRPLQRPDRAEVTTK